MAATRGWITPALNMPTLPDEEDTTATKRQPPSDNSSGLTNPLESGIVFLLLFVFFILVSISVMMRRRHRLRLLLAAAAERNRREQRSSSASPTQSNRSERELSNELTLDSTVVGTIHIVHTDEDEHNRTQRRRPSNYDEPPDYDSVAVSRNSDTRRHSVDSVTRPSFTRSVIERVEEEEPPAYEDVV